MVSNKVCIEISRLDFFRFANKSSRDINFNTLLKSNRHCPFHTLNLLNKFNLPHCLSFMSLNYLLKRRLPIQKSPFVYIRVHRHLSYTSVSRYSQDGSTKDKPSNKAPSEPESPDPTDPKKQKTTVDNFLESIRPHLNTAHQQYNKTKTQINSVIVPFKFHFNKAKDAIKEANEKLAQQEQESQNYDFNQDLTKNGTNGKTIQGLPSERERKRRKWAKKLELYIDSLQETIFTATRALNDVTGYSAIQKLRESIEILEKDLEKTKEDARNTKEVYSDAIAKRLQTQKEVNELLQRQHSWSPSDLERFTKLYKDDHETAAYEKQAKEDMEAADAKEEDIQNKLSKAILTRYHEEQIWSDKIRRTSTWGTFGLMGINILLFLVFQLALEPWKRRRLVGNFEQKVQQVLEENAYLQNEKLDVMSKKVEELQESDRLPILNESLRAEVIEDPIEPPAIYELPLPPHQPSLFGYVSSAAHSFMKHFKPSYNLITQAGPAEATIKKEDLITFTTAALVLGISIGTLLSGIFN